jgi:hypothetical protein
MEHCHLVQVLHAATRPREECFKRISLAVDAQAVTAEQSLEAVLGKCNNAVAVSKEHLVEVLPRVRVCVLLQRRDAESAGERGSCKCGGGTQALAQLLSAGRGQGGESEL